MTYHPKTLSAVLVVGLIGILLLGACQGGQITIDVGGTGEDGGDGGGTGDGGTSVSNQTFFILMIVLLVAMFAMVLVAVSSR